mmetsp:Transcript_139196/g.444859  ORF Transcript_139196/g.444859 Transcript_139196/m.444859 type:complete len:227 (+) Transcript_139196:1710-2390(+)
MQEHAFDVADAQVPHDMRREDTGSERPPEDVRELLVQAADAYVLKVEVGPEDAARLHLVAQHVALPRGSILVIDLCLVAEDADLELARRSAVTKIQRPKALHGDLQEQTLVVQSDGLVDREGLALELREGLLEVLRLNLDPFRVHLRLEVVDFYPDHAQIGATGWHPSLDKNFLGDAYPGEGPLHQVEGDVALCHGRVCHEREDAAIDICQQVGAGRAAQLHEVRG